MDNEDFVSYETAQALKMAGFNYPCYFYYTRKGAPDEHVWHTTSEEAPVDYNRSVYAGCSMPTLAQAQKWFREVKQVYVWVYPEFKQGDKPESVRWYFTSQPLYYIHPQTISNVHGANFPTHESALSAGILAALKLIEDKEGGE